MSDSSIPSDRAVAEKPEAVIEHRCTTRVYAGSFSGYPCHKPAKVQRGVRWYCGIHDPVRVAEKMDKKHARWEAQRELERAARAAAAAKQAALERDAALWRAHVAETQRSSPEEQVK